ncbi:MAG: 3'-5' exonuclease [Candidatus Saccharimonas sp.]
MNRHNELVVRGKEVVQSAPQLYIDLDVESDGWPGYGSLLSVGAVSPWGEQFYRELRPTSEFYIPVNREFIAQHGLDYERLCDEGIEPAEAMRQLAEWEAELRERYGKVGKSVLAAFNASYDFPMINLEYVKAGLESPFGITGYCIQSLAQALRPGYDWRNVRKKSLPLEVVPAGDFTHNALEDAIWQQELHFAMVGLLDEGHTL